jgi:hypothetical protein
LNWVFIPHEITPEVTEHTIHRDYCPACKKHVEPVVPDAMPNATLGHNVVALSSWFHYGLGVTISQTLDILSKHVHTQVTAGGLVDGWRRLPPLHPAIAAGAATDGNVELPVDRPTRNLHLVLMLDARLDERLASASRAPPVQWRFVNFVDDRRHDAKGLGSVVVAALASRPLGIQLGQPARKWSGLQFLFKQSDAGLELRDALVALRTARATGNFRLGHAGIHADRIISTRGKTLNNHRI